MGLAISIFIALPIGACVGCCLGPCATNAFAATPLERRCCAFRTLLFPCLLAIGVLCLYVPLFVLCAKYDGVSVSTAMTEGACWSTGGAAPYSGLGAAAGVVTGIGLTGCAWLLFALLRGGRKSQGHDLQVVDVERGSDGMVGESNGEQVSADDNAAIIVT